MLKKRSQVSIEYVILVGFILVTILVPSVLIAQSMAGGEIYGGVNSKRTNDLGDGLLKTAKQLYFFGLYSKQAVSFEVPDNVEEFFLLEMDNETHKYYYIGIFIRDTGQAKKFFFQSDVPLYSEENAGSGVIIEDYYDLHTINIPECEGDELMCTYYRFTGSAIKTGMKNFKLETKLEDGAVKVSIMPVLK